jgi:hypothetical protein
MSHNKFQRSHYLVFGSSRVFIFGFIRVLFFVSVLVSVLVFYPATTYGSERKPGWLLGLGTNTAYTRLSGDPNSSTSLRSGTTLLLGKSGVLGLNRLDMHLYHLTRVVDYTNYFYTYRLTTTMYDLGAGYAFDLGVPLGIGMTLGAPQESVCRERYLEDDTFDSECVSYRLPVDYGVYVRSETSLFIEGWRVGGYVRAPVVGIVQGFGPRNVRDTRFLDIVIFSGLKI